MLPSGTVTFLFTDIEGSTPLWESMPQAMKTALARHNTILSQAIKANGGIAFKVVGDSYQAAFAVASHALSAALDSQRALAEESWGETGPLRVRMGMHTGLAEPLKDDYATTHTLNRVARVMSAAFGGQILLTKETAELIRTELPPGVTIKDLGEHRLKGLSYSEQLYQVSSPGLQQVFPLLPTQVDHPNNLPPELTSFVGREAEVSLICEKLLQPGIRLLTLTGVGGIGKTRISLRVGQQLLNTFPEGVFFVPLAPVREIHLTIPSIAAALGLRESPSHSPFNLLKEYLAQKELLLLLDNFEQILGAGPALGELLAAAPKIKILVTSRTLLRLAAEHNHPVSPLSPPDMKAEGSMSDIEANEAVQLFVQRARAVKPDFQLTLENAVAVAEICSRMDGLPLAIELAAARCRLLTPQKMLDHLESRLRLLVGGARDLPERHQTMRAAIDWSFELLDEEEQILFRRLAVFAGGCFVESVETVCGFDGIDVINGLESLVDKNLVRLSTIKGESRFWMYETIREYGLEILEASGEGDFLRKRHAHYYIVFANRFTQELNRIMIELDNLRAILRWSIDSGKVEMSYRLMNHTWFWANLSNEGRLWLDELLAFPTPPSHLVRRGYSLYSAGQLAIFQGDFQAGREKMNELQSLADQLNNRALQDLAKFIFAYLLLAENHLGEAIRVFSDLEKKIESGMEWWLASWVYFLLSSAMVLTEDYVKAKEYLQSALNIFEDHHQTVGITESIRKRGFIALAQGNFPEANSFFSDGLELANQFGSQRGIASFVRGFAGIALGKEDLVRSARLFGATDALIRTTGSIFSHPDEQAINERNLRTLRDRLDEKLFASAWLEGVQMNLDEAIAYALDGAQAEVRSEKKTAS